MAGILGVVALGSVNGRLLEAAGSGPARVFGFKFVIEAPLAEPGYAFNPSRNQHNATAIVRRLGRSHRSPSHDLILGIGPLDLFEPEGNFLLAHGDRDELAAVVGTSRLATGVDEGQLISRVLLASSWAVGRALGLRDCDDLRCTMAKAEEPLGLDRRSPSLCGNCRLALSKGDRSWAK